MCPRAFAILTYGLCLSAFLYHSSTKRRIAWGIKKSDCEASQRGDRIQGDQWLRISGNTAAAVIRRYRISHSTTNQSHSGHPAERTTDRHHYLHNQAVKNRKASARDLAQGSSMEIRVSVTDSVKDMALYHPLWTASKTEPLFALRLTTARWNLC